VRIAWREFKRGDVLRGENAPAGYLAAEEMPGDEGFVDFDEVGGEDDFGFEHSNDEISAKNKEGQADDNHDECALGALGFVASAEIPDAEKRCSGYEGAKRNEKDAPAQRRLISAGKLGRVELNDWFRRVFRGHGLNRSM